MGPNQINSCISPGTIRNSTPTPPNQVANPPSPPPEKSATLPTSHDNFTDECLHLAKLRTKLNSDGLIKPEAAAKLTAPELQIEAVNHLHTFFTQTRLVEAKLTEEIRQDIRDEFPVIFPELYQEFFQLPFMKASCDIIFSAPIIPGRYVLNIMEAAQATEVKLIGGESRRALYTTFVKMVETLCEQTLTLPQSKIDQCAKCTPDWDLIIPFTPKGKKNGPIVDKIIPQMLFEQIFPTENPKFKPLLINLILKTLCKTEFIFEENSPPITSIVLGSTHNNKIDITVTPDTYHNQIFELGALGLTVSKATLNRWIKESNSKIEASDYVHIDFNRSFNDKGHQAALDNVLDLLHCYKPRSVNKKGFVSYMGWLSKGAICSNPQLAKEFLYKLCKPTENQPKTKSLLATNLVQQHNLHYLSHESGSQTSFIATLLNTLVTLDEDIISSSERQHLFETFKNDLKGHLLQKTEDSPQNIFSLIAPAFGESKIGIDLLLDWLSLAAYIKLVSSTTSECKVYSRNHAGKTALQIVDGRALIVPYLSECNLQRILSCFSDKSRALSLKTINLLTSVTLRLWKQDVLDIERIKKHTELDLEVLANFGLEFLNHPSLLLKLVGFQLLTIHHIRSGDPRFVPELLSQVQDLYFENTEILTETQITKNLQTLVSTSYPALKIREIKDPKLSVEENTIKWILTLNKSNQPEFIKKSMQLWTDVSTRLEPIAKSQTGVEIMESLLPGQPNYALAVFLTVSLTTLQSYRVLGSIIKVLATQQVKIATVTLLHKSLLKLVEAYKSQTVNKTNNALELYHNNYLWAVAKVADSFPDEATSLTVSLLQLHLLKSHAPETLKTLISICSQMKNTSQKVKFWEAIEAAGCLLAEYHGADKKKFLVDLCEGLRADKSKHLKAYLDLTNKEELGEKLNKRLKAVIADYFESASADSEVQNSETLESQLEPEQRTNQVIKRLTANLNGENLLETEKAIKKLFLVSTSSQQDPLVALLETILNQYILAEIDSDKNYQHLEFFLNFYLSFFQNNEANLRNTLAKNILILLNRQITEMPLIQVLPAPIIELLKTNLNSILKSFHSLGLENECCHFLKQYCFRKLPIDCTEEFARCALAPIEGIIYNSGTQNESLHLGEQTLKALKLYRIPNLQTDAQRKLYSYLLDLLINEKSSKVHEWLVRLFQVCTPSNPLQGRFIANWVVHLNTQKSLASLDVIYAKRNSIVFLSNKQRAQIMMDILKNSLNSNTYSLAAHILINEHYFLNEQFSKNINALGLRILECLESKEENLPLRIKLLELFMPSQSNLWITAFKEIVLFSNQALKDQILQLFENFRKSTKNNNEGILGKCFIYTLRATTQPNLLKHFLHVAYSINQYFLENQTQDLKEAFSIIFEKNFSNFLLCKNEQEQTEYLFLILGTRFSLKFLPAWCELDDLMLKHLAPLQNIALFERYLKYLVGRFELMSKEEINKVFQTLITAIPKEHQAHQILLCRWTAFELIGRADIYPLLKSAATDVSIPFRIGAGLLLLGSMLDLKPRSKIDTVITYCLISKLISDKEDESNLLAARILQHPHFVEWFGPEDVANLWEQMLHLQLNNGIVHENVAVCAIAIELLYKKMHLIYGRAKKYEELCNLAIQNLVRLLLEFKDISMFHVQLTSLFAELVNYRGPLTLAEKNIPQLPSKELIFEGEVKSPNPIVSNLEKLEVAINEAGRKKQSDVFLNDDDDFGAFVAHEISLKDDPGRIDFYIVCKNSDLFKRLTKKLPPSFRSDIIEAPPKTTNSKELCDVQIETLEYIFTDPRDRAFYVKNIMNLYTALLSIKTNNYYIKKYIVNSTARQLVFLINQYKDFEKDVLELFQKFLLSPVAVDSPIAEFRTEKGKEHMDQMLHMKHTDMCQQILTILLDKEKWDLGDRHIELLFKALVTLYPEEIHMVPAIAFDQQALMIGSVLATLLESGSILHYYRGLQIMSRCQNLLILHLPTLRVLFHKIVQGLKSDPFYLIHEKRTIHIGKEERCAYYNKRPLYRIAMKCLDTNYRLSGIDRFVELETLPNFKSWINGSGEVTISYAHMLLEIAENPDIAMGHYDVLVDLLKFYRNRAELGTLITSFATFHACIIRTIPLVFNRINNSVVARTIAYNRYNITDLFEIPFEMDQNQKKARAWTLNLWFNNLLMLRDVEISKDIQISVRKFLNSEFYKGCREETILAKKIELIATMNGER